MHTFTNQKIDKSTLTPPEPASLSHLSKGRLTISENLLETITWSWGPLEFLRYSISRNTHGHHPITLTSQMSTTRTSIHLIHTFTNQKIDKSTLTPHKPASLSHLSKVRLTISENLLEPITWSWGPLELLRYSIPRNTHGHHPTTLTSQISTTRTSIHLMHTFINHSIPNPVVTPHKPPLLSQLS